MFLMTYRRACLESVALVSSYRASASASRGCCNGVPFLLVLRKHLSLCMIANDSGVDEASQIESFRPELRHNGRRCETQLLRCGSKVVWAARSLTISRDRRKLQVRTRKILAFLRWRAKSAWAASKLLHAQIIPEEDANDRLLLNWRDSLNKTIIRFLVSL